MQILRRFCLCEAFLREEWHSSRLLHAVGTDWASSVMSVEVARFGITKCLRYFLLGLGGSNLERASWNSAASILTGVENSSMEVSPSQGIFVQYVDLSQERKEDARLPRALGGIGVRAKLLSVLIGPLSGGSL